jgi:hypothetical protein
MPELSVAAFGAVKIPAIVREEAEKFPNLHAGPPEPARRLSTTSFHARMIPDTRARGRGCGVQRPDGAADTRFTPRPGCQPGRNPERQMPLSSRVKLCLTMALLGAVLGCSSDPTSNTTPPTILVSGSLEIPATYDADLDVGAVPAAENFADGDIWNESVSGDVDLLSVVNTTRFKVMGTTAPGYSGCAAANYAADSYALIGATVGTYFCVKTSLNHYAQVKLTKTAVVADHNIEIDYITWN